MVKTAPLAILLALIAIILVPFPVQADSVLLAPSLHEIRLHPDQPHAEYHLNLTNTTTSSLRFRVEAVDFQAADERGGITFSSNPDFRANRYQLSAWMRLSKSEFELSPQASTKVTVTVINNSNLALGGHYGAVLFKVVADGTGAADEQVTFEQTLSSLLFLTKLGGEYYDLRLEEFSYQPGYWRLPAVSEIKFHNNGNVHTVPEGEIEILDPFGRTVYTGEVNREASRLLPESSRRFTVALERQRLGLLPGYYTAQLTYTHSGSNQSKFMEYRYFVWNLQLLPLFLLALATGVYLGLTKPVEAPRRLRTLWRKLRQSF